MTLEEILNFLSQTIFLLVAVITLLNWARHRDQSRLDIALVFISLALAIIAQYSQALFPALAPIFAGIFFVAILTQPYLLLRVARYFRPVSTRAQRTALFGLLLTSASLVLAEAMPILVVILFITYFTMIEGYASYLLIQGALTIPGITGKRLRLASIGSGLLALVFLIAFILLLIGFLAEVTELPASMQSIAGPLIQILALLSGLSYYFGFAPPHPLLRSWQNNELRLFLLDRKQKAYDSAAIFDHLITTSVQTVGGATAIIAHYDTEKQLFTIDLPGEAPQQIASLIAQSDTNRRVWYEQKARLVVLPDAAGPHINQWAGQFEARALFLIPIKSSHPWGILIVVSRYAPLFVQDDLDLLTLLADQSAISLDYSAVVEGVLHSSEERFRLAVEAAPSAIISVGANGKINLVNLHAQKLFGYGEQELLGHPIELLVPERFRGGHINHRKSFHSKPASRPMGAGRDLFGLHKDGREIPIEIGLTPYESSDGHSTLALIVDITERKRAEEEIRQLNTQLEQRVIERTAQLQESEEKFSKAFLNSPAAVSIASMPDGRYINVNEALSQLTGYSKEELIGHTSAELGLVDTTSREKILAAAAKYGFVRNMEIQIHTKSNDLAEVLTSVEQIEIGGRPCTLSVNYDITERKRAEAEVRQLNQELEQRQTALEATNRELEAFSYSVSHDLRAPLRSIDGFSQAVMEDYGSDLPEQARESLMRVRKAAQHMAQLIDDLLNLARVSRALMKSESVDLSNIADVITVELQRNHPHRKVQVAITPNQAVRGDPHLLQVALENLLNNAWKFTSKQEQAEIEFKSKNENGGTVYFVRDNGVGFDMAYAGKLFGAFQRLHGMGEFPGTGVGLATVQRIIHRHGGRIWAESAVGNGATFYFTLWPGNENGE